MISPSAAPATDTDLARLQTRTVRLLVGVEIVSGLGVALGIAVGALLTEHVAGTALSGAGPSAAVVGGALMAIPVSAIMQRYGRRPGMVVCYLIAAVGGLVVVGAAQLDSVPLLFGGFILFGAATTGKLQARFAAIDLAIPQRRGRQLSLVVWATTIGAVLGPNLGAQLDLPLGASLPREAGPVALASLAFLLAAVLLQLMLRPDPLVTARQLASGPAPSGPPAAVSLAMAGRAVLASPAARLGVIAAASGHLVMVAVMAMTPLHIKQAHPVDTLRIVGLVISLHIAGMYALSPVMGWLTDRAGRRPVILGGVLLLVAACVLAGTAGHDTGQLTAGLILLGLGWSATMVAGSTLLTESIPVHVKARAQGLSDLVMGMSGATAGLLSGVVVSYGSYQLLSQLAAFATVPLIVLTLWRPLAAPTVEVAD